MRISLKAKKIILNLALIIMLLFLAFLILDLVVTLQTEPTNSNSVMVSSSGVIGPSFPYLVLQISPPGYPPVGDNWRINVFIVRNPGKQILEPALNATVTVTTVSSGEEVVYQLSVSEDGEADFVYRPECSDIAFQAHGFNGTASNIMVLTSHFVQSQDIENPLYFSGSALIAEIATILIEIKKTGRSVSKARRFVESSLIGFDLVLLTFVTAFAFYARMFLGTIWGYPENILDGFITVTLIKYAFTIGFLLFLGLMIYGMFIFLRKYVRAE